MMTRQDSMLQSRGTSCVKECASGIMRKIEDSIVTAPDQQENMGIHEGA